MTTMFNQYFREQMAEEVDFGPVMRFSLKRVDKSIEHFVFVEGLTDELFYANTNVDTLSHNTAYFYRNMRDKDYSSDYTGKEAVFYSLSRVRRNDILSKELERCMFIVDRDFSETISSKHTRLNSSDYQHLWITKGHSMENYFLEECNLLVLFSSLGVEYNPFWEMFSDFALASSHYYAQNAVITENYNHLHYVRKHSPEEIMSFDFSLGDNYWNGYSLMLEECEAMSKVINRNASLRQHTAWLEQKIRSAPRFIRGHDAFAFLEAYLFQKHQIQINLTQNNIMTIQPFISQFEVQLVRK